MHHKYSHQTRCVRNTFEFTIVHRLGILIPEWNNEKAHVSLWHQPNIIIIIILLFIVRNNGS